MKHKTEELSGVMLDAAVATADGMQIDGIRGGDCIIGETPNRYVFSPSRHWFQGGPIIEREQISVTLPEQFPTSGHQWHANIAKELASFNCYGPTALIAAMRAFVMSQMGEEVDL